jgi:hypothetical protein
MVRSDKAGSQSDNSLAVHSYTARQPASANMFDDAAVLPAQASSASEQSAGTSPIVSPAVAPEPPASSERRSSARREYSRCFSCVHPWFAAAVGYETYRRALMITRVLYVALVATGSLQWAIPAPFTRLRAQFILTSTSTLPQPSPGRVSGASHHAVHCAERSRPPPAWWGPYEQTPRDSSTTEAWPQACHRPS